MKKFENLDQLKAWAKENGFIYPSSEIYGGFAAVYDYGHYGILLKNNIQRAWEKSMVQERNDVYQLDSGIFMHPKTWIASGHVASFNDVLVEDKKTHKRYRADHLVEEYLEKLSVAELEELALKIDSASFGELVDYINKKDSTIQLTQRDFGKLAQMVKERNLDKSTPEDLMLIIAKANIKSPEGNELTEPRNFNLMVKTNMGTTDNTMTDDNVVYARAETCQGIYLEYKNFVDTMRVKLPFGIAQVGKAFRNEIVARQFIFRTREFEQMEMQYFLNPKDMDTKFDEWRESRMKWHIDVLGISAENLRFKKHEKLAHYASAAYDIEYNFNTLGGFKELEGIHARGDWDLSQHQKFSGTKLEYFDEETRERYIPNIMETSVGLNRLVMMVLEEAYTQEELTNAKGEKDTRVVLKVKKDLAPIKVAILPLSKKPDLQAKSLEVQALLKADYMTQYDETASIGKRYRRQDEIGTPYCVTVDFDTLNDNAVTVRDRDSMQQERIQISELKTYIDSKFSK